MAEKEENTKADVSDTKSKMSGVKTEDSKREGQVESVAMTEAAKRDLDDRRAGLFGDNTSSSGEQNVAGQHGRDGGEINEQPNNPAPAINEDTGVTAEEEQIAEAARAAAEGPTATEETEEETPIKKL